MILFIGGPQNQTVLRVRNVRLISHVGEPVWLHLHGKILSSANKSQICTMLNGENCIRLLLLPVHGQSALDPTVRFAATRALLEHVILPMNSAGSIIYSDVPQSVRLSTNHGHHLVV